ncbi:putative reverse transcriptase domain-containing protein [Tanacetum coccineum]
MPPKSAPLTQSAIRRMIKKSVDAAIAAERARHANVGNDARGSGPVRGQEYYTALFVSAQGKKVKIALLHCEGLALTLRFNELALMCPRIVEPERVKVNAYIRGLTDNIKGEVTSSKPANLNEAITSILQGGNSSGKGNQKDNSYQTLQNNQKQCERCFTRHVGQCTIKCHKCGKVRHKARSVVNTRFSSLLDIKPIKIEDSYEVELADGRIVSTNTVLKGCTLSLVNHIFEIDLMPIELGTFDVIIGMDWLVKHSVVIVCGEKVVRIPYGNKTLIVEGDKGRSRLKIISCIKARKYVEQGCHLFLAHVTKKKSKEKQMEDVPVIHDFPEVFPEELPGLPPPRQVEF